MADTRPDIILLANTQVDIYTALNAQTGAGFPSVTIGAAISIQNKGNSIIRMTTKATTPLTSDGSTLLAPLLIASNDQPSTGEFVESLAINGLINVRVL